MLIEDRDLQTPTNGDVEIWRYMTLAKFLSMLTTGQLWFSSLEELAKTDPHEGGLALPNYKHRRILRVEDLSSQELKELHMDPDLPLAERQDKYQYYRISQEFQVKRRERYRSAMYVNCWHMNSGESAAMWAAYATGGESVAIVSTYEALTSSLYESEHKIVPYRVDYNNFLRSSIEDNSRFPYPITKRLSFDYERELRLIYVNEAVADNEFMVDRQHAQAILRLRQANDGTLRQTTVEEYDFEQIYAPRLPQEIEKGSGVGVEVKIKDLVQQVRVAPTATDWFYLAVKGACHQFCLSPDTVEKSDITSERFQ